MFTTYILFVFESAVCIYKQYYCVCIKRIFTHKHVVFCYKTEKTNLSGTASSSARVLPLTPTTSLHYSTSVCLPAPLQKMTCPSRAHPSITGGDVVRSACSGGRGGEGDLVGTSSTLPMQATKRGQWECRGEIGGLVVFCLCEAALLKTF